MCVVGFNLRFCFLFVCCLVLLWLLNHLLQKVVVFDFSGSFVLLFRLLLNFLNC